MRNVTNERTVNANVKRNMFVFLSMIVRFVEIFDTLVDVREVFIAIGSACRVNIDVHLTSND
jgi:hypothetical protein